MGLQAALRLIYPPQCIGCDAAVGAEFGLCPDCWRATPFISGQVCDQCGVPLPGEGEEVLRCDDCLRIARPWSRGRAVMLYDGKGRDLVLALKHADRLDLARPAGGWLARAGAAIMAPGMLIAPVPMHWLRLIRKRQNHAAVLARALARETGAEWCPDLSVRRAAGGTQDGRGREGRFANVAGAFAPHPRRGARAVGRHVLLIDDVMTSGATLAAAADACLGAGADEVSVLTLARVTKTG
ncbi:MAG: double zinc ribbon domain-containing protein [Gemmobacter sp.]